MTTQGYRNKPQFNFNETLNKDTTPNVPTFEPTALDNDGVIPLNNCHKSGNKEKEEGHECCHGNHAKDHEHKHCCCDHKNK